MRLPDRVGFQWRFSLGEIMVAVAIDALLVAAIGDLTHMNFDRNDRPWVYNTLAVVAYVVVPFVVAPFYFVTRLRRVRRYGRWHSRRNDIMLAVDVALVLAALSKPLLFPSRDHGLELVIRFIPIAFTLFVMYSLSVQALQSRRTTSSTPVDVGRSEPFERAAPFEHLGAPRCDGTDH